MTDGEWRRFLAACRRTAADVVKAYKGPDLAASLKVTKPRRPRRPRAGGDTTVVYVADDGKPLGWFALPVNERKIEEVASPPILPPPAVEVPQFGPLVPAPSRPKTVFTVPRRYRPAMKPVEPAVEADRPLTRADCVDGPRPCPWVGCKWHLAYDVDKRTGSIKQSFPGLELEQLRHTCALDVAELGGVTLEQAGDVMNVTRERIRQIFEAAAVKVAAHTDLGVPEERNGWSY